MRFGKQVRSHRVRLKLSQRELAERLGVDGSTISLWESGQRVPHHLTRREIMRQLAEMQPVEAV